MGGPEEGLLQPSRKAAHAGLSISDHSCCGKPHSHQHSHFPMASVETSMGEPLQEFSSYLDEYSNSKLEEYSKEEYPFGDLAGEHSLLETVTDYSIRANPTSREAGESFLPMLTSRTR